MAICAAGCGIGFGIRKAIPDVLVEVPALGFRLQQLLIDLYGDTEVTVDRSALEFQVEKCALVLVGSGVE